MHRAVLDGVISNDTDDTTCDIHLQKISNAYKQIYIKTYDDILQIMLLLLLQQYFPFKSFVTSNPLISSNPLRRLKRQPTV